MPERDEDLYEAETSVDETEEILDEEEEGGEDPSLVQAAELEQRFNTFRERLNAYGWDIGQDGQPLVRDLDKVRSFVGADKPLPAPAPAPAEEEMPNPYDDPVGFQRWHKQSMERATKEAIAAATAPLMEQLQSQSKVLASRAAVDATARIADVLDGYGLGDIAGTREFRALYSEALTQLSPEQLADEDTIERVAFMCVRDAKKAGAKVAPRAANGQFVADDARARATARANAVRQAGPSREGGRAARPTAVSEDERLIAEQLGLSPEEVRALQDPTGAAYTKYKQGRK